MKIYKHAKGGLWLRASFPIWISSMESRWLMKIQAFVFNRFRRWFFSFRFYIFSSLFALFFFACQSPEKHPEAGLELQGLTNGLPDGTIIYAVDILTNQIYDSAMVRQDSFLFVGGFDEFPVNIFLHTTDYQYAKSLWIENNAMTFDASNNDFAKAVITGSETNQDFERFLSATDTIGSDDEIEEYAKFFIGTYPESRFSASMLAGFSPNWDKAVVKDLFDRLSIENQNSEYGRRAAMHIELNRAHEIGDIYSDFEMKDPNERVIRLSDHLGKVTLLEFWASWCGPCRQQNPELVKTYMKYKPVGFEIFAVSLDFSVEDWKVAIQKDSLFWHHVSDLKGRNSTAGIIYGINTIPDNILLNEEGVVIGKYLSGDALNQAIEKALK